MTDFKWSNDVIHKVEKINLKKRTAKETFFCERCKKESCYHIDNVKKMLIEMRR